MTGTPDPRSPAEPVVSIVLATYNERQNLPELLGRVRRQPLPPWEMLVVDDGSTDGTRELVLDEARNDLRIRPLFHDGKQTTLGAQCQGILATKGSFVVVMDADLQHPPELLPAMVGPLAAGAALVVASRYTDGGSPGPRSPLRAVISRGAEGVAKILLPEARRLTDPVSGFFAFRRSVFRPLDPRYRGYKLLLFLLVMAGGSEVREVGFRFEPRASGASKVAQGLAFVRVFLVELILARRLRRVVRRTPPVPVPAPEARSGEPL
jgi:dolichol-phosphate mannosyltransferase